MAFNITPPHDSASCTDLADLAERTDVPFWRNTPPVLRDVRHDGEIYRINIASAWLGLLLLGGLVEQGLGLAKGRLQEA